MDINFRCPVRFSPTQSRQKFNADHSIQHKRQTLRIQMIAFWTSQWTSSLPKGHAQSPSPFTLEMRHGICRRHKSLLQDIRRPFTTPRCNPRPYCKGQHYAVATQVPHRLLIARSTRTTSL
jgi:hypothetical protein